MTIARYSFLPWLRRGIANQMQTPAAAASRAKLAVAITVASDVESRALPPREVQLIGPGDIIGFNPQLVVRTEPRNWIADFEPNYLSFVEFYDEDFAWRYTPAAPDSAAHRLTPWITLVLLKETEFQRDNRPGKPLPSIKLTPAANVAELFAPDTQLWAWAHVHVNDSLGAGHTPNLDGLEAALARNPDTGYCRLVCPRRLEPNTGYNAMVVPTFEVGRKAGLGEPVGDADPGLAIAWAAAAEFPVYYEWYFRTGAAGDFEELVRALKPRVMPKEVGIRDLDIQRPGFGLPPIVSAPEDVVGLEGALLSPYSVPKPLDAASNFPPQISKQVNLAADVAADGVGTAEDPLVTAPLYGRWHALVERISADPENRDWVNEVNRDPRFRAPAGMGTLVIQKGQEEYMKLAWQQIGEILAVNRKIHFVQMAVKASQAAWEKHLAPLPDARALPILAPVFSKVMGSPVTVSRLVGESRLTRAAMSGPMRKQLRPRGLLARRALPRRMRAAPAAEMLRQLNRGAISAAPPRPVPPGPTLERVVAAVPAPPGGFLPWLSEQMGVIAFLVWSFLLLAVFFLDLPLIAAAAILVATVAAALIVRRLARQAEPAAVALDPADLTPEAVAAIAPNASFRLAPAGQDLPAAAAPAGSDSPDARDFRSALTDFHALLALSVPPPAPREEIAVAAVHATVLRSVEPVRAFPLRMAPLLRVGGESLVLYARRYSDALADSPLPRIVPAMAYPDIKKPMYEPLRDIDADLFVPNLRLIPPNTISLMVVNQPFIEAYMVGVNHEFGRELLWREYPTDQRGSTFRQFWDASNYVDKDGLSPKDLAEKVRDITRIHEWEKTSQLGDHNNREPIGEPAGDDEDPDKRSVVLVIRGDLLKRYPNTIIYAQRARWGESPDDQFQLLLWDETGEKSEADPKDPNLRFPLYKARVGPDIHFTGFDLTIGDVRGAATLAETAEAKASLAPDELGWFFVIKEVVGEPRFGLDESSTAEPGEEKWDNLSWENLGVDVKRIDVEAPLTPPPPGTDSSGVAWGANAADMAFILYQKPVLVAVHGREMLAGLT